MNLAIITVAYNRVSSLNRLLKSLECAYYNEAAALIISIDKSNTDKVEVFADNYNWPHGTKIVDKHEKNLGLRSHMMSLGKWFNMYDAIIVLEDDIVVSPNFYIYSQQCVNKYYKCKEIAGISLYGFQINYLTGLPWIPVKDEHDVYFMNCAMSWGEIWMKQQWEEFYVWYQKHILFDHSDLIPERLYEWNEKSWLKYHTRYCIEENKYFIHPYTALSSNYGDAGVHAKNTSSFYQIPLQRGKKDSYSLPNVNQNGVYYDGFFENKDLYQILHLDVKDCCLDLNGTKRNRTNKKYWLTTRIVDYKIIKSYGLNFRPIEMNVIESIEGTNIFLYDTSIKEKNKNKARGELLRYYYYLGSNISNFIFKKYGLKQLIRDFSLAIITKIKK